MPALVAGITSCFPKATKFSIKSPLIPAKAGIQDGLGPRNGVPATRAPRGAPRGDERTLKGPARTLDAVAVLDHPDAEQRRLRRPAVPVVVGLLAHFRPDEDS